MKKKIVLGVLFIFPIVIYLFFASGKNNFAKLPVLSEDVLELDIFKSFEERKVRLKDKITILGYWGDNLNFKKAEALNLNEKIYKRFYEFNDLQFVIIMQENKESEIKLLKNELRDGAGTNLLKWNFLTSSKENIERHFNSLKIPLILEKNLSSPYVFIIDKEKKLRGRNDDEDIGVLYGFDARSVAEINKKMIDDVKVILAEYRLALKRYNKVQRN
ncbi:MAG: hypothetical protein CMC33_02045 [Flavobacteriaceae bacterium]|nr:hypothetical protein [Flavobacteriaceae bacterium]